MQTVVPCPGALLRIQMRPPWLSSTTRRASGYLSEFDFRYNARRMNDGERTALAIQSASGKRLTYKQQIAKPDVA